MANGFLGKGTTTANTNVRVYLVPDTAQFCTANISFVNRGSTAATVRLAISTTDNPNASDYIEYGLVLEANGGGYERSCLLMSAGERVVVWSDSAEVTVRVSGLEQA